MTWKHFYHWRLFFFFELAMLILVHTRASTNKFFYSLAVLLFPSSGSYQMKIALLRNWQSNPFTLTTYAYAVFFPFISGFIFIHFVFCLAFFSARFARVFPFFIFGNDNGSTCIFTENFISKTIWYPAFLTYVTHAKHHHVSYIHIIYYSFYSLCYTQPLARSLFLKRKNVCKLISK